jgi:3-oxoacyl-[acyl-carrier-protein] synthase III
LIRVFEEGLHHLAQDYSAVQKLGPPILANCLKKMVNEYNIKKDEISYIIGTIPSEMLLKIGKEIVYKELSISPDRWFSNVNKKGYSGGSSIIIALDELIKEKMFKKGQLVIGITVESSKWMVGGFILRYL